MMPIQAMRLRGVGGDPYFANVALLLHGDGTNGSTSFPDSKGNTWSANGDAQVDTSQKVFGTGSILLDGSGDYVSGALNALALASADFTIEAAVRLSSVASDYCIIGKYLATGSQRAWFVDIDANGLYFVYSQLGVTSTTATALFSFVTNTWYRIAVVRSGGNILLFVNGSLIATVAIGTSIFTGSAPVIIGATNTGSLGKFFPGWLDEIRLTTGVARYTASYTVDAAPFPDQ